MDFLEENDSDDLSLYLDVQNLSIDHSLSLDEIEKYKDLIFSPNSISQIYFKKGTDKESIEIIKNLLSISDYINDQKVEKYVLIDMDKEERETFLNSSYENPSSWSLPYENNNISFTMIDIPMFRVLVSYIKSLENNNLSPIEMVMKVYDSVKMFDYETKKEERTLPKVVLAKNASQKEYNELFSYILDYMGFKTFIGTIKCKDKKTSYVTLVDIKDSKHELDGIYLFDPSMDTLSKEEYKDEEIRRINYNFFGLNTCMINKSKYEDRLSNVLSLIALDNYDYSYEKINSTDNKELLKEIKCLLSAFNLSYKAVYERIRSSISIDCEKIAKINCILKNNPELEQRNAMLIRENYKLRKKELFESNFEEELANIMRKLNN